MLKQTYPRTRSIEAPESLRAGALDALLHEYDDIAWQLRLSLLDGNRKLGVGVVTAMALCAAGLWRNSASIFLFVPFALLFPAPFIIGQAERAALLAAQLAVIERRVNGLVGAKAMTFYGGSLPALYDALWYADPETGEAHLSSSSAFVASWVLLGLSVMAVSVWRGWARLVEAGPAVTALYFLTVAAWSGFSFWRLLRARSGRRRFAAVIEAAGRL